ncbi:VOC family protein [bacterium]|nr:VOC family protein [bacterium]
MITGIAHVCFTVDDLDRALDFYENKLGLRHAFDFLNDANERFGCYLYVGHRNFIEIFQRKHRPPDDTRSYKHLCLEVDDIEETITDLREKGVDVTPAKLGGDYSWQAWITDPDGNRIELHGYTPESRQGIVWERKKA